MKIEPAVKQETLRIAIGTGLLCALTLAVYLIIGKFTYRVLLGVLLGGGYSVLNFFLLGMTVQKASKKARERMAERSAAAPQAEEKAENPSEEEDDDDDFGAGSGERERNKAVDPAVKNYVRISYYLRLLLTAAVLGVGIALPCFDTVAVAVTIVFPRLFILLDNLLLKRKAKDE